jgi:hypothetical protein
VNSKPGGEFTDAASGRLDECHHEGGDPADSTTTDIMVTNPRGLGGEPLYGAGRRRLRDLIWQRMP